MPLVMKNMFVCVGVLNCSLDHYVIGPEGGVALGEILSVNQTLQILRYI